MKLVKEEIQKLTAKRVNQVSIGLIKAALGNVFALQVFMMIHQMNYAELAIILGSKYFNYFQISSQKSGDYNSCNLNAK